jgi:hypothetical protein
MLQMTSASHSQALPRATAYAAIRNHSIGAEALLVDRKYTALRPYTPPAHLPRPRALPLALSDDMRQISDKLHFARFRSCADMDRNKETCVLLSLFFNFINVGSHLVLEDVVAASVQHVLPQDNPRHRALMSAICCCASACQPFILDAEIDQLTGRDIYRRGYGSG